MFSTDDLLATLKLVNVKSAVQLEVDDHAGPEFQFNLPESCQAELRYDLKNGIISLEDWKRSEDVCKKILLILLDQRDFTKISSKLIGRRAMMIRHFKLSGYSIATIHWSEFGQLKNKLDRIKFLNNVLESQLKNDSSAE
ncbi:hypothetical protein D917_08157 [Trichinella nativa]|uniref:RAP domain-containing protein n=1 Tax=Trichinella nativa TaxID=6335 RepID=A0A1Y3EPU1_9BILA|nr:hypothetical protein D917_08157 [Trichinella nativa]